MKQGKYIFAIILFSSMINFAQDSCRVILEERSGKPMLVGVCDRSALADTNFAWWFNSEYENYSVDSVTLQKIENEITDYDITIVMGTWCSDSRREVPRFYKILDELDYPEEKIKLNLVDRSKKGLSDETDSLNIQLVPTFIFYNNGEEAGRIIESPEQTLEKDLEEIVLKEK